MGDLGPQISSILLTIIAWSLAAALIIALIGV